MTFAKAFTIGVLSVVLLAGTISQGQALSEEVRATATHWLLNDCGLQSTLRAQLQAAKSPALETFFLDALQNGPDASQIADFEKEANRRYDQRQQALKRPEGLGLSPQDIMEARKLSREDFLTQEKKDFDLRYRSQAVAGLGLTGGNKATSELQRIAKDPKSPLQTSARAALNDSRQPDQPKK